MGELAEIEGLNPTMLSRLVGKLEAAGLVQRRRAPTTAGRSSSRSPRPGPGCTPGCAGSEPACSPNGSPPCRAGQAAALMAAMPALESLAEAMRPAESVRSGAGR